MITVRERATMTPTALVVVEGIPPSGRLEALLSSLLTWDAALGGRIEAPVRPMTPRSAALNVARFGENEMAEFRPEHVVNLCDNQSKGHPGACKNSLDESEAGRLSRSAAT